MNVSQEVHDVLKTIKLLNKESEESIRNSSKFLRAKYDLRNTNVIDEIIDVNSIDFGNDEVWLYEVPNGNSHVRDLNAWLYQDSIASKDIDFHTKRLSLVREIANMDTKKCIDSRTFTRPKKRLNRLSIDMYDGDYFKSSNNSSADSNKCGAGEETLNSILDETGENSMNVTQIRRIPSDENVIIENHTRTPLSFDLTQPTTSNIFDNISGSAPELDSFQNMSPPSLVNSLCSSTFANLMENSIIKNDPVLREIRDADYTEADLNLPKSFTDSCSSISSDTTEKFLKHAVAAINKSYNKDVSLNETYTTNDDAVLDSTYLKDSSSDVSSPDLYNDDQTAVLNSTVINNVPPSVLNGTFRKSVNNSLNATFKKSPENHDNTITIVDRTNVDNNHHHRLMKRRSYILDNRDNDLNQTTNLKRNSMGYSPGSSDSLDYMSSRSSSSKGSNKMLNMAEVDAIVYQQEQSIQVMSTPKASSKIVSKLWQNQEISPITPLDRGDLLSDSETSSNDEYRTVTSSTSNTTTVYGSDIQLYETNRSSNLQLMKNVPKTNNHPRSLNSIPMKMSGNNKFDNNYKGSYSNLKTVDNNLKGSYTNLKPKSTISGVKGSYSNLTKTGPLKGSYTNLKTMSNHLKGSYTQLRPVLTNLPCADADMRMPNVKKNSDGNLKIAEVAPTLRDINKDHAKSTSALNYPRQQVKTSGLPRPISGIPRPAVSRIPAPRTMRSTNLRPTSRPLNKVNFDGDF